MSETSEQAAESPWEPGPIPAERFHNPDGWANINRAPYDRVSGVLYKRAANIKRVRYEPADPAPTQPQPWQGHGATVVHWLFSEQPGTEEHLLEGKAIAFLHDTTLLPDAATGMQAHDTMDKLFYVLEGEGTLHHRPTEGSPVIARPLRPGDAALVHAGEYHRVANDSEAALRMIVIGLQAATETQNVREASQAKGASDEEA